MKRILSMLLLAVTLMSFASCGKTTVSPSDDSNTKALSDTAEDGNKSTGNNSAKALVVYFSCTGNTKAVAGKIAELADADLYEIVPETPYTADDLNYSNDNCRANKEMNDSSSRPKIGSKTIDFSQYDTIYLGYPIWWGTMPKIINTFLDSYDLSGKTVHPFCTSGSSGISTSVAAIKNEEPGAVVTDGLRAAGETDSAIDKWIKTNS